MDRRQFLLTEAVDDISNISNGSGRKIRWCCSTCKLVYVAKMYSRMGGLSGCPYCSNRKVSPTNNIKFVAPLLAGEVLTGNSEEIIAGSNRKIQWKCSKCAHIWNASPNIRVFRKIGCPACAGHVATIQHNLFIYHPVLASELLEDDPTTICPRSSKRCRWKCKECDYIWTTAVNSRVKSDRVTGCPACFGRVANNSNNLLINFPEIARELVSENPSNVTSFSNKKLKWACSKCSETFDMVVGNRTVGGQNCPKCSNGGGFKTSKQGWFYILDAGTHRIIGITNNLEKRIKQYPSTRKLVWWITGPGLEIRKLETRVIREIPKIKKIKVEAEGEMRESTIMTVKDIIELVKSNQLKDHRFLEMEHGVEDDVVDIEEVS